MKIPQFSLEGKKALVTGGGTGIGHAIALTLADAGADVAVTCRRLQVVEKVAEEIKGMGRKGIARSTDVSKVENLEPLVE